MLKANKLLAMAKDIGGFYSIVVSEMFFQFTNHSIVRQFWGSFQEHLSPNQFGILTPGGCDVANLL
jgi:hypothetical protein